MPSPGSAHRAAILYGIATRIRKSVEISLQKVGSANSITVYWQGSPLRIDTYRATFMSSEDPQFKDLGDIPRDLAMDSALPEVATCYIVCY